MTLPVWIDNLIAYSLQIAFLAAVGTLLVYIFRLRVPRVSLLYWQMLLLACVFLPVLQKWEHPAAVPISPATTTMEIHIPSAGVFADPIPINKLPIAEVIVFILAAGAVLRVIWLAIGFVKLHLLLRKSNRLEELPPIARKLSSAIGIRAHFYLSGEINSPATFGIITPTIILPGVFHKMSQACQEAVVCHELLHVRRRDWILVLIEEIIRTVFWFHPAVWWLLSRIHLTREQSVDREVVHLTGSRQPYLDSLLEIAQMNRRPNAVPAPLFLKERQLVERIALLLKEVHMNRTRLILSLTGIALLLAGTVRLASGWFPLTGSALTIQEETSDEEIGSQQAKPAPPPTPTIPGVVVGSMKGVSDRPAPPRKPNPAKAEVKTSIIVKKEEGQPLPPILKIIRKVDPEYPELARRARVEGEVVLKISVNEEGYVSNVEIISGHQLLRQAAVDAVKQWKYEPALSNGKPSAAKTTVMVHFVLPEDQTITAQGIAGGIVGKIPGGVVGGIAGGIPGGKGAVAGSTEAALADPKQFISREEHDSSQQTGQIIEINAPVSNLIRKVPPRYPELARRARVEGEVVLKISVNEEGDVSNVEVISGHQLLRQAAVDAVKQWRYEPTVLNGKPVPVIATITVNFVLPENSATPPQGGSSPPTQGSYPLIDTADKRNDASPGELSNPDVIVVSLSESGQITINKEPITIENLGRELQKIFRERTNKNMFLKADAKTDYGDIVKIVDIAKGAGAEKIALITDKTQ
jgi:TonB family protein